MSHGNISRNAMESYQYAIDRGQLKNTGCPCGRQGYDLSVLVLSQPVRGQV
jgi:hypothetical protein